MKRLTLRLPDSLHAQLKEKAEQEKIPLNQYTLYLLSLGLGKSKLFRKKECPTCNSTGFTPKGECEDCGGTGIIFLEQL